MEDTVDAKDGAGRPGAGVGAAARGLAVAAAVGLALASHPAGAVEIEGVPFPERIAPAGDSGPALELHGAALFRYRVFFRAYVAALYLPPGVEGEEALSDVPKRLELSYFWAIEGEDFGRAADRLLAQQLTREELALLRPRIDALHRAYRSIEPGHRYALTYTPGIGTELSHNGEPIALIPGADFAEAYFGIWLGETAPLDAELRAALLREDGEPDGSDT